MKSCKSLIIIALLAFCMPLFAQETDEEEEKSPKKEKVEKKGKKENIKDKDPGKEESDEPEIKQDECPETENTAALKLYNKSQDKKKYEYKERMEFLKLALEEDPEDARINLEYARQMVITLKNRDQGFKPSEKYYKLVASSCPNLHSDPYYYLAIIYWEDGNYKECLKYSKMYLDFKTEDEKKVDPKYAQFLVDMKGLYKWSKVYEELYGNPVPYDPQIAKGLSSERAEYLPIISMDDQLALYTRQVKPTSFSAVDVDKIIEKFFISKRKSDGTFDSGDFMPDPFNKGNNEGGATMTIDNNKLYFTICRDEGGAQPECDIWFTENVKGKWAELKKVNNINYKDRWDSQPSITQDGNTIYFSSNRPGGMGGTDIWYALKDANGIWGQAKNAGPKINTSGDEKAPFMHSDSQTLYFSSGPSQGSGEGGLPGVGGMDIYYIRQDTSGKWQEPKNIGIPINTKGDEVGLIVSTDGHLAYFASDDARRTKNKTMGGYDIYYFILHEKARPKEVVFFEGELKDPEGKPFKEVDIEIKDAVTKHTVKATYDTINGNYRAVIINTGADLLITAETPGHAFVSTMVSKKDSVPGLKLITKANLPPPAPVVTGSTYQLNNIYYKTGSAELDKKSMVVLEEFASWMKKNPIVAIEIHGHTDDVGNDIDNMALSKDRAFTVMETLLNLGVKKEQLTGFKGFGKSRPLPNFPNTTEYNRSKNRRTEFLITEPR